MTIKKAASSREQATNKLISMFGVLEKIINQISKAGGIITVFFLVVMLLITVADVFMRYIFNAPIIGASEIIQRCMALAGFLGLAWCAMKGGHLTADLIPKFVSTGFKKIIDVFSITTVLTIVPIMAWRNFIQANYAYQDKYESLTLKIPEYPFYIVAGTGLSLLTLAVLVLLIHSIKKGQRA